MRDPIDYILDYPLVFIGTLIVALCGFGFFCENKGCTNYGKMTGRKIEYLASGGCFVQAGSVMIPQKEFMARAVTNEK